MFLGEGCVHIVLVGEGHRLLSPLLEEGSTYSPNQVESQMLNFPYACLPQFQVVLGFMGSKRLTKPK